jgi:hypothetical protein
LFFFHRLGGVVKGAAEGWVWLVVAAGVVCGGPAFWVMKGILGTGPLLFLSLEYNIKVSEPMISTRPSRLAHASWPPSVWPPSVPFLPRYSYAP